MFPKYLQKQFIFVALFSNQLVVPADGNLWLTLNNNNINNNNSNNNNNNNNNSNKNSNDNNNNNLYFGCQKWNI